MTLAFGLHYSIGGNKNGSGAFIEKLNAAGIPVMMKGVGDAGLCFEAQESGKLHGVNNILVYRLTNSSEYQHDTPRYDLPPSEAARMHFDKTVVKWPSELDKSLVWMEPINEPRAKLEPNETTPTWGGMHPVAWLGSLMVEYTQIANGSGFKVCGPSFSSGEPEPEDWQLEGMATWLQYCADNPTKAAISHHEYNYGNVPFANNYPWHYGRFQSIIAAADKLNIPRTFQIFLTEFGWTYETVPPFETAVPALTEYAKMGAKFPQLKGVALWTLQTGWGGISDQLAAWISNAGNPFASWVINNQYPELPQPQATADEFGATLPNDEEPPMKHKAIVVKLPQDMTAPEWNQAAAEAFQFRHTMTASHDDMLTILNGGNDESYVKFSHPARDAEAVALVEAAGYSWQPLYEDTPPTPPPDLPYLDVEPLEQRHPAWANKVLGQNTGHGKTIGNWGCLLVAYTMQANFWGLTDRLPDHENDYYVSMGAFVNQFIQPGALKIAYPNDVTYDGFLSRSSSAMRPKIREWIDKGWPVPCRVDFNPADSDFDQHWVLVIGYVGETDFYMADPWHGDIELVNNRYPIAGSDILEALFYKPETEPSPQPAIDVAPYFVPAAQYGPKIVMQVGSGTQPMQLEKRPSDVILRKGDGNWIDGKRYQDSEQWRVVNGQVQKGKDTSDAGNGGRDGYDLGWVQWIPQFVSVGQTYHSTPTVKRFNRTLGCQVYSESQANDYLHIKKIIPTWVSPANSSIVLNDVLVIEWRSGTPDLNVPPNETYYFAKGISYVGWGDHFIVEITQGQGPLTGALDCGM